MATIDARLLEVDYVRDPLRVRLFCVDAEGEHHVAYDDTFDPYFYVVPEQDKVAGVRHRLNDLVLDDDGARIEPVRVEEESKQDGQEDVTVLKVVVADPPHVPKVKEHVQEWEPVLSVREYDVPFYKRYLIDHDLPPTGWIRMDGEYDEKGGFRLDQPPTQTDEQTYNFQTLSFDLEVIDDEIIMCSLYADGFEKLLVTHDDGWDADYVEVVEDEEALLKRFVAIVQDRDPDILTGYNTDEFDFQVLRDRAEEHNVTLALGRTGDRMIFQRRGRFSGASLTGRIHLDLYAFVENVVSMGLQSDTLSLDAVAEELLGENKDDVSWDEMKRFWREKTELDKLARYAVRDAELAHALGESLVPQILSLSELTGLPPFDTCRHSYGQLVENFLIKQAHHADILVPNRPSQDERSRRYREGAYAGGFVYEPEKGLHDNIALFDFRSLYPTIIVAHNISPDVLDMDACEDMLDVTVNETTYRFCQDVDGFIPRILEDLVAERYELKGTLDEVDAASQAYRDRYNRQNALKILSNAFYGYLGYNGARWYSKACAEATTALGRQYIQNTIATAEDMGFDVVYGDTDSVFLKGDDIMARADTFQDRVNAELPEFMELELEGFFVRGLFTYTESGEGAKKKYALLGEDGTVKITGFEQVRRDWSQIAKDVQEAVIHHVLENDVEGAVAVVEDAIKQLQAGDVPMDKVKIYTQMKKKPENYKAKAPHTEAAKKALKRGEDISPGDVIAYVITAGGGTISDRAELVSYADNYDATYYIEKQVLPVALRVLKVFGYTEDQLLGKGKQTGLGAFT